jgi:hypothetical protein
MNFNFQLEYGVFVHAWSKTFEWKLEMKTLKQNEHVKEGETNKTLKDYWRND